MKKFIYCVLIALIALSCDKADDPLENTPIVIPKTLYAQASVSDLNSRAVSEYQPEGWDDAETVDSRTYAVVDPDNASEYFQYWSPSNAISVFCTTKNLQYQMNSYKDGTLDIGKFELVGNASQGTTLTTNYYYGVYPYKETTEISKKGKVTYIFPETQHFNREYNGDSYSNGENGMIAIKAKNEWKENENNTLYFKNFCSYLQLRLFTEESQSKTVKKIILIANDETNKMAGEGTIEIQNENSDPVVKMKTSATNQITLDCGNGVELSTDMNTPTKFWFVLPGGFTFKNGFRINILFDDYTYYKQSTSKPIGILRNHIKPMETVKPIPEDPTGPLRYKYNDPTFKEPYHLKNTFLDEEGNKLDILDQIYDETTGEWVVLFNGTLKTIGSNSFEEKGEDIEYIKVNNEETPIIINDHAFYDCTADSLIINNDILEVNEYAFASSTINKININGDVTTFKKEAGKSSNIEEININGDVTTFEEQAFSGCTTLKTINMDDVTTIDKQAFSGCIALQTVNIDEVETIGNQAFYMCSNLKTVNVTDVKTIDYQAFNQCAELETVNITNVESIGFQAFYQCEKLSDINLTTVKYIEQGAFRKCTSLTTINLNAVITIGNNAFYDCSQLTSAVISEHCILIGESAFCKAYSLNTVYCYAVYPPFIKTNKDDPFVFDEEILDDICIYIPLGSAEYYLDDEYFEDHPYDETLVNYEVNWWYENYEDILQEME